MSRNTLLLARPITAKVAYDYLTGHLKSHKIESFQYDAATDSIEIVGNYYQYRFSFLGTQVNIKPKWSSKWLVIILVCAITGFFFLIPFIGVAVIAFIADGEYKEIKMLVQQTLMTMPVETTTI